jgi:hypothetical protein
MSNTYFDMLPYELIEIIFKKLHKSYMQDIKKELKDFVDCSKCACVGTMCLIGECDCGHDCPALGERYLNYPFNPRITLNHIDTPEEKKEYKWFDSDSESESEDEW